MKNYYQAQAIDNSKAMGDGDSCGHKHRTEQAARDCADKMRRDNPCKWSHYSVWRLSWHGAKIDRA